VTDLGEARPGPKPGAIEKRSVLLDGHRTSVSLEPAFWEALREIAEARGVSVNRLVASVDRERAAAGNLSSALRVFVLEEARGRG
jgi:predicted DNA-binding ribbon-helix-helix protein